MIATNQALNVVLIFFVVPRFCKLGTIHICTALKKLRFIYIFMMMTASKHCSTFLTII